MDEALPGKRRRPSSESVLEETSSGIPVKPVYTASDLPDNVRAGEAVPGEYPFDRGIYAGMYRDRLWTIRQYAGFSSAEESNQRYRYLLDQGVTGLSVAFDLPTQIGYDSDHPLSEGEVGRVGVAVDSVEDMARLFDGIPLARASTSMTINATAPILLAMYVAVARRQGIARSELSGTIQNDILKEYVARGTYIFPPGPSMRLVTDVFEWCSAEMPRWHAISVSGYHIREAGATAAEELAFTLANGLAYVSAAVERGLDVNALGRRLSFFFSAHNDFFEEIAKFRAARRLWARLLKDRFGATEPRALHCRFHTQTAGSTLTAQQPENNVVRVALQAFAAVLGGTQSLHTNSADEALSLPSERAARTALRTQQIIAHETGVARTADPLGGSYFVERLTADLESEAEGIIGEIEAMGGAVRAIERGYVQECIARSAYRYQRSVEEGTRVVVGVNRYQETEETVRTIFRVDEEAERAQRNRLQALRRERDRSAVQAALDDIGARARSTDNVMPALLRAVEARATVGEISDVLRGAWGVYGG